VKIIEVQPPLAGVEFEDGTAMAIYNPNEAMFWFHEESKILVPDLMAPGDVKKNG
jgi:hypothetical protein